MEKILNQKKFYELFVADSSVKLGAGFVDTGGKFATGINNASESGGKILPPVSLIPVAILPPVSLIPVVHLDLKIRNGLNGKLCGWGKLIREKNRKQKSRYNVPLNFSFHWSIFWT
jgi:hypothetical protein